MIPLTSDIVGWMFLSVVLLAGIAITGNIAVVRWALQGRGLLERQRDEEQRPLEYVRGGRDSRI